MHIHSPRRTTAAAITVAAAVAGPLAWAPAAAAHAPEPTSSASAPAVRHLPETGGVKIFKKDPDGRRMAGAAFTLLDDAGKEAASGRTDAEGRLAFEDLSTGVYRLKETDSGSPLHTVAADQDVIVTPGTAVPLTVIDPFKPANLTVKKTDKSSGKPLPGAIVNVTPVDSSGKTGTVTTGKDGTATVQLPVTTRTGTPYKLTESKAPSGYELDSAPAKITAKPGAPETVTLADTPKCHPTPSPTETAPTPTAPAKPAPERTPGKQNKATPRPEASASGAAAPTPSSAPPTPQQATGSLAHTGADSTPWLLGTAGVLLAGGAAVVIAARRRRSQDAAPTDGR
ncbi:SpaA isopeptide-forming pilin-related protein [Streptomyces sp. NPDC045470]|uniref:MSCRAMM family protein n=1 Tax=Streptomyces sp. NPDC045470 TaxID=3155469 RepID=UPI0033E1C8C5